LATSHTGSFRTSLFAGEGASGTKHRSGTNHRIGREVCGPPCPSNRAGRSPFDPPHRPAPRSGRNRRDGARGGEPYAVVIVVPPASVTSDHTDVPQLRTGLVLPRRAGPYHRQATSTRRRPRPRPRRRRPDETARSAPPPTGTPVLAGLYGLDLRDGDAGARAALRRRVRETTECRSRTGVGNPTHGQMCRPLRAESPRVI
jgi:hypothetical protein